MGGIYKDLMLRIQQYSVIIFYYIYIDGAYDSIFEVCVCAQCVCVCVCVCGPSEEHRRVCSCVMTTGDRISLCSFKPVGIHPECKINIIKVDHHPHSFT